MGKLLTRVSAHRPLLQIALDFIHLSDAVRVVNILRGLDVDIFEAGTPLLKSEGIKAVKVIKDFVGDAIVLADMKTADTGALEVRLAVENGADAVSVLASADNEVISSALNEARNLGADIVVDTIGRLNISDIIDELIHIGVRIINLHMAIDVQRLTGMTIADKLKEFKSLKERYGSIYISVSGGIKPQHIREIMKYDIDIIVMGSAVTRAQNPADVVKEVLKIIR